MQGYPAPHTVSVSPHRHQDTPFDAYPTNVLRWTCSHLHVCLIMAVSLCSAVAWSRRYICAVMDGTDDFNSSRNVPIS
jgi:hypothetical protein